MELLTNEILEQTKQFWKINEHTIFHNTISLVISQKVSFNIGRNIRIKLFELIGSSEFTKDNISQLSDCEMQNIGLDKNKIILVKLIIRINKKNNLEFLNELLNLKGIGKWTIKALQILNLNDSNIFLSEDLWIRKRLSELIGIKSVLTIKDCDNLVNFDCKINKSNLTRFLWRIKPEGIIALKNKQLLCIDHFL